MEIRNYIKKAHSSSNHLYDDGMSATDADYTDANDSATDAETDVEREPKKTGVAGSLDDNASDIGARMENDDDDPPMYKKKSRRPHRRRVLQDGQRNAEVKATRAASLLDYDVMDPSAKFRVSAYCICDSYLLPEIVEFIRRKPDWAGSCTYFGDDVVLFKLKRDKREVFIFEYGSLAFFNYTEEEELEFIRMIDPFEEDKLNEKEREVGVEDLLISFSDDNFYISNDTIYLKTKSSLEKLSVAFAMAQCVKLNVFEERIEQEIERNRTLPESLASTGSIGLSRNEMAMKVGKLFIERNNINLHFDILDTPEFFWEQDKFKNVYESLFNYLELGKRVNLLNKRLGIMKELFDMISDQLENMHAEKLEWIIIWLIVVEVVVMVVWNIIIKDILKLPQKF